MRNLKTVLAGIWRDFVAETGSTNADLLARAAASTSGLDGPVLLLAGSQTAGRGRAGRSWQSAPDASLTFSLAWKFDRALPQLVGLPLAVGVAIAEALHACGLDARLKWPNDVLLDGRKLAGILIETQAAPTGASPRHAMSPTSPARPKPST